MHKSLFLAKITKTVEILFFSQLENNFFQKIDQVTPLFNIIFDL